MWVSAVVYVYLQMGSTLHGVFMFVYWHSTKSIHEWNYTILLLRCVPSHPCLSLSSNLSIHWEFFFSLPPPPPAVGEPIYSIFETKIIKFTWCSCWRRRFRRHQNSIRNANIFFFRLSFPFFVSFSEEGKKWKFCCVRVACLSVSIAIISNNRWKVEYYSIRGHEYIFFLPIIFLFSNLKMRRYFFYSLDRSLPLSLSLYTFNVKVYTRNMINWFFIFITFFHSKNITRVVGSRTRLHAHSIKFNRNFLLLVVWWCGYSYVWLTLTSRFGIIHVCNSTYLDTR